eukprot:4604755-Amphidinium_carterae.1
MDLRESRGALDAMLGEFKICLASTSKSIDDIPDISACSCHLRYTATLRCLRAWWQGPMQSSVLLRARSPIEVGKSQLLGKGLKCVSGAPKPKALLTYKLERINNKH